MSAPLTRRTNGFTEAPAWRWMDHDELEQSIWIRGTLWHGEVYAPKTERSEKLVHLPPVLVDALKFHWSQSEFTSPTDHVFRRTDGRPLCPCQLYKHMLYPAMDAAGIKRSKHKHGFHLFKRSGSRILYKLTRDTKLVRDLLRHSRVSTTVDDYIQDIDPVRDEGVKLMTEEANFTLTVPQIRETIH